MEVIALPVVISKEGKWYVACCPPLDLATQGRTEKEVKENMKELIDDYLSDPDTPKPELESLATTSVTVMSIPVSVSRGVFYKAPPVTPA
jgi:predicted RNase H-like HicB family nuclease